MSNYNREYIDYLEESYRKPELTQQVYKFIHNNIKWGDYIFDGDKVYMIISVDLNKFVVLVDTDVCSYEGKIIEISIQDYFEKYHDRKF